ncbi:hypothetical protein P7C73_g3732, partial [Tremellales sp. Uapishka_1]
MAYRMRQTTIKSQLPAGRSLLDDSSSDVGLEVEEGFDLSLLGLLPVPKQDKDRSQSLFPSPRAIYSPLEPTYPSAHWNFHLDTSAHPPPPLSFSTSAEEASPLLSSPILRPIEDRQRESTSEVFQKHSISVDLGEKCSRADDTSSTRKDRSTDIKDRQARLLDQLMASLDASEPLESKPRRQINAKILRTKLPSGKYRTGVKVRRRAETSPSERSDSTPPEDPPPAKKSDFESAFGESTLLHLEQTAKTDAVSAHHLPQQLGDLFESLSDAKASVKLANTIRRELDLPMLSPRCDKIALKRIITQTRERLYVDLMAALSLPLAPAPTECGKEDPENKRDMLELTPYALQMLAKKLPKVFPSDKAKLKSFMKEGPLGEMGTRVIWQGGIGRMLGESSTGVGYRGKSLPDEGCHVFVDHSNILYGLITLLSTMDPSSLPPRHLRVLSLPALSLLLRRGRPTPCGTLHAVASSPLLQNLGPLVRLGWAVSVLKRVEIYTDEVNDPLAAKLTTKPQAKVSSGEGTRTGRYKEQCVDEILHLKMLQTMNKCAPGTMVLATGDAKGGQFEQDGFLGAVREAMKRGWRVELWSFKAGMSRLWKETARREGWLAGGRFAISALDDWAEQLVEVGEEDD